MRTDGASMKIINGKLLIGLTLLTLVSAPVTRASIISLGDPYPTESWAWNFHNPESFSYNHVEGVYVAGSTFEGPGFTGLSAGWSSTYYTPTLIAASGPALMDLVSTINFNGDGFNSTWDYNVYNGSTAKASYRLYSGTYAPLGDYDAGGGWRYDILPIAGLTPVPEPSSYVAGALLLLPFGISTVRSLRKPRQA